MAGGLKFRIKVEEKLYYPYSENKGADQISFAVTAKLICVFVFAYAKAGFLTTWLIYKISFECVSLFIKVSEKSNNSFASLGLF